tara:strand:- start:1848 stop:2054 length:207 start_codon:yes stop_codon:yes gene_type:complete
MENYYVNKNVQTNGDHEVHKTGCSFLPSPDNRIYLGAFSNCKEAVLEAKRIYSQVNGCYFCSRECHTS